MVKEIKNWVSKHSALRTEENMPFGQLIMYNENGEHIELDNNLASLLGISKDGLMRNGSFVILSPGLTVYDSRNVVVKCVKEFLL